MRKLVIYLACLTLVVVLAPRLEAQSSAPVAAPFLTGTCPLDAAAAQPTEDPAKVSPADLFLPAPTQDSCSVSVCISECNDCPWPKHPYCISTQTCVCGCH